MIINREYFVNENYIPSAKPTLADSISDVSKNLDYYISKYSKDCLLKCLGYKLYSDFVQNLDISQPNGLKSGADQKWDDLLNGKEYVDVNGVTIKWEGIRRKIPENSPNYNSSFLADYVFVMYEQTNYVESGSGGHRINKSKNATTVAPTGEIARAWNRFVTTVQGKQSLPDVIHKSYGIGLDWYSQGEDVSLYRFINDINELTPDTYKDFVPGKFRLINSFGI